MNDDPRDPPHPPESETDSTPADSTPADLTPADGDEVGVDSPKVDAEAEAAVDDVVGAPLVTESQKEPPTEPDEALGEIEIHSTEFEILSSEHSLEAVVPGGELLEPASMELDLDDAEILDSAAPSASPKRAATVPPAIPSRSKRAQTASGAAPAPPPAPTVTPFQFTIDAPTALDSFLAVAEKQTPADRVAELERALDAGNPARTGELAYELGELHLSALGDEAKAVKAHGVALRADPSLRANLWAIRRIFYRRGLWPNLVKLIGAELRFVDSARDRADLEVERGRIYEDELDDTAAATGCYSRAVAHDPTYLPALIALERRALREEDNETLVAVWRHLANATTDTERKETYLIELGHAIASQLASAGADTDGSSSPGGGLGDEADGGALQQSLSDPFAIFDEAAALEGDLELVARERLRAARLCGNAGQMVRALEEQIEASLEALGPAGLSASPDSNSSDGLSAGSPNVGTNAAERVRGQVIAYRRRQAMVQRLELGDTDGAWAALEKALAISPGNSLVLADLADLAESAGRYEALAELVETWRAQEADPTAQRGLALRRVRALRRSGDEAAAASLAVQLSATYRGFLPLAAIREGIALETRESAHSKESKENASETTALAELSRVYGEMAIGSELGSLFGENRVSDADGQGAANFRVLAATTATLVGDSARAREQFSLALELDPLHEAARDGLVDCLTHDGNLEAAAGMAQAGADSGTTVSDESEDEAEAERRCSWSIRAASLWLQTGELDSAIKSLEAVADDLGEGELLWLAAIAVRAKRVDVESRALVSAAERMDSIGDGDDLDRRGQLLGAAARAIEFASPESAADLYRRALEVAPDDVFVRALFVAMLRRTGNWESLAVELGAGAQVEEDPARASSMWMELAAVQENRIDDRAGAALAYREVLDLDLKLDESPGRSDKLAAIAGLLRVCNGDERLEVLQLAMSSADPSTRLDGAVQLARALIEKGDSSGAESAAAIAAEAELEVGAKTWLGDLLSIEASTKASATEASANEASAKHAKSAESIEAVGHRVGGRTGATLLAMAGWRFLLTERAVSETFPGGSERAVASFDAALKLDSDNRSALLGALIGADGDGEARAAEAIARTLTGSSLSVSILRSAGVHAAAQSDETHATQLLAHAMNRGPDDLATAIALTEFVGPSANIEASGETDRELLEAVAAAWQCRGREAGVVGDVAKLEHARCLARLGRFEEAGKIAQALALVDSGSLVADPAPVALLVWLARKSGDHRNHANALVTYAERCVAHVPQRRSLAEAARLFDETLSDLVSAVAVYWRLVEIEPGAAEGLRLAELLRADNDYGSLWDLYSRQIAHFAHQDTSETSKTSDDPRARASAFVGRGRLRLELADATGASRDLSAARECLAGADSDEMTELAGDLERDSLAVDSGQRALRESALVEAAKSQPNAIERARLLVELARLQRLSDPSGERATATIVDAISADPTNLEAATWSGSLDAAVDQLSTDVGQGTPSQGNYARFAAALELVGANERSALALAAGEALAGGANEATPSESFLSALRDNKRALSLDSFSVLGAPSPIDERAAEPGDESEATEGSETSESAGWAAVWLKIADAVSRLCDPTPSSLGLALADRTSIRELVTVSPIASALYERLRLHAEVYILPELPDRELFACATSANRAMVFLSADVVEAASANARFHLGRALLFSRERSGTLSRLSDAELRRYMAGARSLAGCTGEIFGIRSDDAEDAAVALKKSLPTRLVSELPSLAETLRDPASPLAWRNEMVARADRFGLTVSGSIGDALKMATGQAGGATTERAANLLTYATSEAHVQMRRVLGIVA